MGGHDAWITRFRQVPDAPVRLVCFPHAGGSAGFYFPMAQPLDPYAELLAVQYPGRQNRRLEPCVDDIEALADAVAAALAGWQDRPLALFGHSMGALVAFETARRLRRPPVRLYVSGRRAPTVHREESVHRRDDDGIVAELRALSGTDLRVLGDEEILRMILPAVRADYRAVETYRPDPGVTVDCPVTALVGDSDPRVGVAEARAWAGHTAGPFELAVFPGGHFYLAQHQRDVIKLVAEGLGELAPSSPEN
ncbi:alpha/beta fold hydrolase [Streptomyces sp. NPDC007851]|uniref:thioesterase II family protein n=1 Tax=Streptomyces sp. NPDC007851 TaxID=3155008 RepID=UPI0033E35C7B